MALTTFGAIMKFAEQTVTRNEGTYRELIGKAKDPGLKAALEDLAGEEGKNRSLMEMTRRENVTEMILEPITGLEQQDYEFQHGAADLNEDRDILREIVKFEEKTKRFFQDASSRVPLPEVARTFRRVARRKEDNLARLQGLGLT